MLVWAVLLTLAQLLAGVLLTQQQVAMTTLVGNRDDMPIVTGVAGRALRAHRNMLEVLPLFAALVLVATIAHKTTAWTTIGAEVFVIARLGFAVVYVAGIPWVRTVFWMLSLVALVPFFSTLLG